MIVTVIYNVSNICVNPASIHFWYCSNFACCDLVLSLILLANYIFELTDSIGTIILGRKMTDGFVSYWSDLMNKPDDPFYEYAKKMIETPKVVFTKTLKNRSGQIRTLQQVSLQRKPSS